MPRRPNCSVPRSARSGVDKDLANLRLGMSLARAGDKAGATAALNAAGGAQAEIAKYWLTYLAQQGLIPGHDRILVPDWGAGPMGPAPFFSSHIGMVNSDPLSCAARSPQGWGAKPVGE